MSYDKRSKKEITKLLRTFRVPGKVTLSAAEEFFSALDCPRSLTAAILLRNQEYEQLVALECLPSHYNSASEFRDAYAATKFLSKNNFLKLNYDRKEVAMKKFFEFEELCKQTNNRFRDLSSDPLYRGPNVSLLHAMICKIEKLLGDYSTEEFFDGGRWGPGVSTLIKGEHVSAVNKFQCETGTTRDLFALVQPAFRAAYPRWQEHLDTIPGYPTFELGNVIITVPKDAKTDRVIAVEPGVNLWFQLACGQMIRRRLQRYGIDLNSQSANQRLALVASKEDTFATVDFSSASDSISRKVVEEVIPPKWLTLLDACRSHYGIHNDQRLLWNKFSSMGNGFTFELESLIFYTAAAAVCEYLKVPIRVSVFGDDVIIPKECYELFCSFSEFLGFKVNLKKSFSSGYFRESCGSHFWNGVDVKPIYLKEMAQHPFGVYRLANSIRRLAHRRNVIYGCDARLRPVWKLLVDSLPLLLRVKIDDRLGDGGFISNFDEVSPSRARDGQEGYLVRHATSVGVTQHSEASGLFLAHLDRLSTIEDFYTNLLRDRTDVLTLDPSSNPPRGENLRRWAKSARFESKHPMGNYYTLRSKTRITVSVALVPRWTDLGPWI